MYNFSRGSGTDLISPVYHGPGNVCGLQSVQCLINNLRVLEIFSLGYIQLFTTLYFCGFGKDLSTYAALWLSM